METRISRLSVTIGPLNQPPEVSRTPLLLPWELVVAIKGRVDQHVGLGGGPRNPALLDMEG